MLIIMYCSGPITSERLCSFSVAGSLVCPVSAVRDLGFSSQRSWCGHVRRTICHVASLHFTSFVTFVDTSPSTASVSWCRLCTQDSTTATSSWSDFQHIHSGASSLFLALRLVWCSDLVATIMSRTLLQLYISCVYHNVSTSRWLSWRFVCCMVSRHHT